MSKEDFYFLGGNVSQIIKNLIIKFEIYFFLMEMFIFFSLLELIF